MKSSVAPALALALGGIVASSAIHAADRETQPEVAVLRAENQTSNRWWEEIGAERAQSALIGRLVEDHQHRVMPRPELAQTLADRKLWLIGELSPAGAIRLGRELRVRYLVATTLVEFGTGARGLGKRHGRKLLGLGAPKDFNSEVVLRLIDTTRGQTVWSDSRRVATPLAEFLSSSEEDGVRVEEAVFERTLEPLLGEMLSQLSEAIRPAVQD